MASFPNSSDHVKSRGRRFGEHTRPRVLFLAPSLKCFSTSLERKSPKSPTVSVQTGSARAQNGAREGACAPQTSCYTGFPHSLSRLGTHLSAKLRFALRLRAEMQLVNNTTAVATELPGKSAFPIGTLGTRGHEGNEGTPHAARSKKRLAQFRQISRKKAGSQRRCIEAWQK